ncbi:VOC family protein [Bogoriella caseilytica]|uniref:Glyoxalase-like protein n=1 Tax=Bogoriella caseilytica TaxID=56055 RepID=A0A3N2BFR9_9MICO|nr:VOC family protein [Bogoriella caseilytica]ROR74060.1 glyoxalase-like protein [Bogoriella caseilytica]
MVIPATLDHLVLAGPRLSEAVEHTADLLGVRPAAGGRHPGAGTANALVAFTHQGRRSPWYLEVIGPDPQRQTTGPVTIFGIDRRTAPALATWAIHPENIEATARAGRAAGVPYAEISPLSRRTPSGELLEWLLAFQEPGESEEPLVPFLIDWGSTAHPALAELPTVELLGLHAEHPAPEVLSRQYAAIGLDVEVRPAARPALVARLAGPAGEVELR